MAKKRVLIVNKFLYPRGGDCIVALTEAELLRSAGHEVEMWGYGLSGESSDVDD